MAKEHLLAQLQADPNDPRHGMTGRAYGCRCEKCVSDYRSYQHHYKAQRRVAVDPSVISLAALKDSAETDFAEVYIPGVGYQTISLPEVASC